MLRSLLAALVLCLALTACAGPAPAEPTQSAEPQPAATQPVQTISPAGPQLTDLPLKNVRHMLPFGKDLLFLSGQGSTTLTLLSADTLQHLASLTLPQSLEPEDLRLEGDTLSYRSGDCLILLDQTLSQTKVIALPPNTAGTPILSQATNTLYYQTPNSIHAWDLTSGIRRPLWEHSFDLELTALHCSDTILQAQLSDGKTLFLDTAAGRLLHTHPTAITLHTHADGYFAVFPQGYANPLVFGAYDSGSQMLLPQDIFAQVTALPTQNAALALTQDSTLEYYDLATGAQTASLTLGRNQTPKSTLALGDTLFFLIQDPDSRQDQLLTWTPETVSPASASYLSPYQNDTAGLALCQSYADRLSRKYGLTITIGEAAAQTEPWDFTLEEETLIPVLTHQLTELDSLLANYPEVIFPQTAAHFDQIKLCLVRSIRGTAESGSLSEATGIQFLKDGVAHVVLAATPYFEQALYHEFFHTMETHLLTHSLALDQWDTLNPAGFRYDYDFAANATRNSGIYLQDATRAFIDTYSMSFPKEDRARVFEYAMLPDQSRLFQSEIMQSKLSALCTGLRDAYGLEKSQDLPWEQYLP